jgi:DNA polymerase III sliding clamp (beta) subunit (PCNA family)
MRHISSRKSVNPLTVTAPASALNAALSLAALAADKKADTPVRIIADRGMITFTVANLRSAIAITATSDATVISAGEAAASATRLEALLSGFAAKTEITIGTAATCATIAGGGSVYRLPLLGDPPVGLAIDPEMGCIELATPNFVKLLGVLPAADSGKTRPYLGGVYLHSVGDKLVSVATDATKLLRIAVPADNFSIDRTLIIPAPSATIVLKLLKQVKPETTMLRRSCTVLSVSAPGFELVTGLIAGPYPEYARLLPQPKGNTALVQRAELVAALARLHAVANGEMPLVILTWANGEPVRLHLAREPRAGQDMIAAQANGAAQMAFSLPALTSLVEGFKDDSLLLDADTDHGVLIQQGDKLAVLMSCRWRFGTEVAA